MKIFQAFSLLTIAHGSKVTRINFRKEGEGLGSRLDYTTTNEMVQGKKGKKEKKKSQTVQGEACKTQMNTHTHTQTKQNKKRKKNKQKVKKPHPGEN